MLDDASSSTSLQPVSSSEEPPTTTSLHWGPPLYISSPVTTIYLSSSHHCLSSISPPVTTISPPSTSNKHPRRMALPCVLSRLINGRGMCKGAWLPENFRRCAPGGIRGSRSYYKNPPSLNPGSAPGLLLFFDSQIASALVQD